MRPEGTASDNTAHCGYVAIAGRPNVGKSTLLNRLVGQKLAAVSGKPQMTRQNLAGIVTHETSQIVFIDTPGIHTNDKRLLNKALNANAQAALDDVDLILFVVEAGVWTREDEVALSRIRRCRSACLLCVNKVDRVKDKSRLLPYLDKMSSLGDFEEIIPISATSGDNLDVLFKAIRQRLPQSDFMFPEEQITDKSERFMVAELVREQLFERLQQELPYSTHVEIDAFEDEREHCEIAATIWVERASQRAIVIGKQGAMLKSIGISARQAIQHLLDRHVRLKLWVKVKPDWQDNPAIIGRFREGN